jgi:hypothetical protein
VVTKSLYGVARTVIVNTRKYDIHRRYVAHVFYAFNNRGIEHTFLKGRYLNQELVDKGFAKATVGRRAWGRIAASRRSG